MIIINAGVPRSGTVLVNAIVRALLRQNNVRTAQSNPTQDETPDLIRRLKVSGHDRHRATLIHTHEYNVQAVRLLEGSPFVTGFINYRDPRDVCVSLMRLHEHTFEEAAGTVEAYFKAFDRLSLSLDLMVIPYELLVSDTGGFVFQIARYLGFWPGLNAIDMIVDETAAERHQKVMDELNEGKRDRVVARKNAKRTLIEDTVTLINDRHIQSGAVGRWRTELTPEQRDQANEQFSDLVKRFGYPID